MDKDINRIKVVLADKKRTNKWLAEQLGKDPAARLMSLATERTQELYLNGVQTPVSLLWRRIYE